MSSLLDRLRSSVQQADSSANVDVVPPPQPMKRRAAGGVSPVSVRQKTIDTDTSSRLVKLEAADDPVKPQALSTQVNTHTKTLEDVKVALVASLLDTSPSSAGNDVPSLLGTPTAKPSPPTHTPELLLPATYQRLLETFEAMEQVAFSLLSRDKAITLWFSALRQHVLDVHKRTLRVEDVAQFAALAPDMYSIEPMLRHGQPDIRVIPLIVGPRPELVARSEVMRHLTLHRPLRSQLLKGRLLYVAHQHHVSFLGKLLRSTSTHPTHVAALKVATGIRKKAAIAATAMQRFCVATVGPEYFTYTAQATNALLSGEQRAPKPAPAQSPFTANSNATVFPPLPVNWLRAPPFDRAVYEQAMAAASAALARSEAEVRARLLNDCDADVPAQGLKAPDSALDASIKREVDALLKPSTSQQDAVYGDAAHRDSVRGSPLSPMTDAPSKPVKEEPGATAKTPFSPARALFAEPAPLPRTATCLPTVPLTLWHFAFPLHSLPTPPSRTLQLSVGAKQSSLDSLVACMAAAEADSDVELDESVEGGWGLEDACGPTVEKAEDGVKKEEEDGKAASDIQTHARSSSTSCSPSRRAHAAHAAPDVQSPTPNSPSRARGVLVTSLAPLPAQTVVSILTDADITAQPPSPVAAPRGRARTARSAVRTRGKASAVKDGVDAADDADATAVAPAQSDVQQVAANALAPVASGRVSRATRSAAAEKPPREGTGATAPPPAAPSDASSQSIAADTDGAQPAAAAVAELRPTTPRGKAAATRRTNTRKAVTKTTDMASAAEATETADSAAEAATMPIAAVHGSPTAATTAATAAALPLSPLSILSGGVIVSGDFLADLHSRRLVEESAASKNIPTSLAPLASEPPELSSSGSQAPSAPSSRAHTPSRPEASSRSSSTHSRAVSTPAGSQAVPSPASSRATTPSKRAATSPRRTPRSVLVDKLASLERFVSRRPHALATPTASGAPEAILPINGAQPGDVILAVDGATVSLVTAAAADAPMPTLEDVGEAPPSPSSRPAAEKSLADIPSPSPPRRPSTRRTRTDAAQASPTPARAAPAPRLLAPTAAAPVKSEPLSLLAPSTSQHASDSSAPPSLLTPTGTIFPPRLVPSSPSASAPSSRPTTPLSRPALAPAGSLKLEPLTPTTSFIALDSPAHPSRHSGPLTDADLDSDSDSDLECLSQELRERVMQNQRLNKEYLRAGGVEQREKLRLLSNLPHLLLTMRSFIRQRRPMSRGFVGIPLDEVVAHLRAVDAVQGYSREQYVASLEALMDIEPNCVKLLTGVSMRILQFNMDCPISPVTALIDDLVTQQQRVYRDIEKLRRTGSTTPSRAHTPARTALSRAASGTEAPQASPAVLFRTDSAAGSGGVRSLLEPTPTNAATAVTAATAAALTAAATAAAAATATAATATPSSSLSLSSAALYPPHVNADKSASQLQPLAGPPTAPLLLPSTPRRARSALAQALTPTSTRTVTATAPSVPTPAAGAASVVVRVTTPSTRTVELAPQGAQQVPTATQAPAEEKLGLAAEESVKPATTAVAPLAAQEEGATPPPTLRGEAPRRSARLRH